jgi:L-ascorbate peroxidase
VSYYQETIDFATKNTVKPKVFVFPSDQKLSQHVSVGKEFSGFVGNQGKWTSAFANA